MPQLFSVAVVLALGGCEVSSFLTKQSPEIALNTGPRMATVALPRYTVGESFTYDDKRTDTVIGIYGGLVTWRTDQGIINKQYSNFLVPSISWQNRTRRSRAKITGNPEKLWPLKIGNNERFNVVQVIVRNDGSSQQEFSRTWQCAVEGTERLTVPAGTFNTFRIPCYRYVFDTSYWRQTRTYYYAPEIGHYVAREDIYVNRPNKRRELVSAGFDSRALPESDQASLGQAF